MRTMTEAESEVVTIASAYGYNARVLPIRSVGVQGDNRTYGHPVALLGGHRDWDRLEEASTRITNSVSEVNRVVYTLSHHELGDITPVRAAVSRDRLKLLQQADELAKELLIASGLDREVWQMPIILVPLAVDGEGESVIVRPVLSEEAMTARFAALPWEVVENMERGIGALHGVSTVFFDITHKPPATIEWE